ncbi:MAG: selenide, water dikinase SelD [Halioglobus sp.]
MQAGADIERDLVLVGGGHSHALVLRMLAMRNIAGVRITLVSPASHTPYSGMLPGLVAGHYSFEQTHIDLARLCQWAGVRFIAATVTGVDPVKQSISVQGRPSINYDVLSIDIGSLPELDSVPGAAQWSVPVKPVSRLWQRWQQLQMRLMDTECDTGTRIAVVGGGAGSVELALAIANRFAGRKVVVDLYCGSTQILTGYNNRARRAVEQAMAAHKITVHLGARVAQVEQDRLLLASGVAHDFNELFWCTGATAAPWLADSGLPTDKAGFLSIRDTLQLNELDNIFAAGDTATQVAHPRPKAGVYAVRQAPVLAANLENYLLGKPLKQHVPQRRFLSLISLGDKKATADRSLFAASGAWVWRWKDRIDREFMARFTDLPPLMSGPRYPAVGKAQSQLEQMPCGGCGAKVSADTLAAVLTDLARDFPRAIPNAGQAEDTATIPAAGSAVLQSIDVLREIVADPWLMGRIAANHALSDLYACGVRPLSALAMITLPFASDVIQARELKQILAGALHEFSMVACTLSGGHSLQGQELNVGFVVNGVMDEAHARVLPKTGLRVGDQLVLTKPLGTGALFASHMQLQADGRDIAAALDMMLQSNQAAGSLALEHNVSAATDVTGFGLLGHLLEMLAEGQGACLRLADVPLLDGARQCIDAGIVSTAQEANAIAKNSIGNIVPHVDSAALELLVDPQTSGGLLLGVAKKDCADLCQALIEAGYGASAVIGEVTAIDSGTTAQLSIQ